MAGGFIPEGSTIGGFIVDDIGPSGGGFIVDHDDAPPGGGFLIQGQVPLSIDPPSSIQLSQIPLALDSLDLPCDESILDIFREVAEGESGDDDDQLCVERVHFRKVCAALLANGADDDSELSPFQEDTDEVYEPDDGDEDLEASPEKAPRKRNKGKGRAIELDDEILEVMKPSRRKAGKAPNRAKIEKLFNAFAPTDTSIGRVITTRGVRMVADLLHESLTDEEILEMLKFASKSDDPRVSLDSFNTILMSVHAV